MCKCGAKHPLKVYSGPIKGLLDPSKPGNDWPTQHAIAAVMAAEGGKVSFHASWGPGVYQNGIEDTDSI